MAAKARRCNRRIGVRFLKRLLTRIVLEVTARSKVHW
jgi:hypothetical protein